jgi:hypothetical protein
MRIKALLVFLAAFVPSLLHAQTSCGNYQLNSPIVISSNTNFVNPKCSTLQLAANSTTNMLVNYAYTQRGYVSVGPSLSSTTATACPSYLINNQSNQIYVQFSGGTGVGAFGYMTVSGGIPTGAVTIVNGGSFYTAVPTTATFTNGSGSPVCSTSSTGTFTGGTLSSGSIATATLQWVSTATSAGATFSNGSSSISASNAFYPGQEVTFTGTMPGNFTTNTSYYVLASGLTGSTFQVAAYFNGPAIVAGAGASGNSVLSAVTTQVGVTSSTNLPSAFVAGQSYVGVFGTGNPSVFNGVFLVESCAANPCSSGTTFTYRAAYIPASAPSGTTLFLQADQNITVDGGQWNYAYANQAELRDWTPLGSGMIFFDCQNCRVQNVTYLNQGIYDLLTGMTRDFYFLDSTDGTTTSAGNPAINRQIFGGEGPMINVKLERISTYGNDDGVQSYAYVGDQYQNVAISQGDLINVGYDHIDRFSANSSSGMAGFFPGGNSASGAGPFKAAGLYATNITGVIDPKQAQNPVACVTVQGTAMGSSAAFLDDIYVNNVSGNCTWSFHIGAVTSIVSGSPTVIAWNANNIIAERLFCNQAAVNQNSSNGGQVCAYVDPNTTVNSLTVSHLNSSNQQNTTTAALSGRIWIDGKVGVLNVEQPTLNTSGSCPTNPDRLLYFSGSANVTKAILSGVNAPCGDRLVNIYQGNANTPTVVLRDSVIGATSAITAASSVNVIAENSTFNGVTNGILRMDNFDSTGNTSFTLASRNNTMLGSSVFSTYASGTGNNVTYTQFDQGNNSGASFVLPVGDAHLFEAYGSPPNFGETNASAACETNYGISTWSSGSTIVTGLNCLPANAVIDAVVYRITTSVSGGSVASFTVGDGTTANRFCTTQSTLTSGTTGICTIPWSSSTAGTAWQSSAHSVVVTFNSAPTAGAMRIIVYYHTWITPVS